jgi:hypothetical protein
VPNGLATAPVTICETHPEQKEDTMSVTIRIPQSAHDTARRLAADRNSSIGDVIVKALERYEEEEWWDAVDASYARLRDDPVASAEFDAEVAIWDTALMDGLEEWPYEGVEDLRASLDKDSTK